MACRGLHCLPDVAMKKLTRGYRANLTCKKRARGAGAVVGTAAKELVGRYGRPTLCHAGNLEKQRMPARHHTAAPRPNMQQGSPGQPLCPAVPAQQSPTSAHGIPGLQLIVTRQLHSGIPHSKASKQKNTAAQAVLGRSPHPRPSAGRSLAAGQKRRWPGRNHRHALCCPPTERGKGKLGCYILLFHVLQEEEQRAWQRACYCCGGSAGGG